MFKFLASYGVSSWDIFRSWVISHATDLIIILLLIIIIFCLFKDNGGKDK